MPGHEEQVPADALVYFHNHSDQGEPLLLLPASNRHNVWTFHDRGYLVRDAQWMAELESLRAEGLYRLGEHLHAGETNLPAKTLVQLGYNRHGDPIVFAARRVDNTIVFPERGLRFQNRQILQTLLPADFVVVTPAKTPAPPTSDPKVLH